MKNSLRAIACVAAMGGVLLSGCIVASPAAGFIFTQVKYPGDLGPGTGSNMGHSECMSVLGWVAIGDASIQAAAGGKINSIHHVDHQAFQVLGIFGTWGTDVYGQ